MFVSSVCVFPAVLECLNSNSHKKAVCTGVFLRGKVLSFLQMLFITGRGAGTGLGPDGYQINGFTRNQVRDFMPQQLCVYFRASHTLHTPHHNHATTVRRTLNFLCVYSFCAHSYVLYPYIRSSAHTLSRTRTHACMHACMHTHMHTHQPSDHQTVPARPKQYH